MKCANCLYEGTAIPHPIDGRESSGVQCFGVKKGSGFDPRRKGSGVDLALDTGSVKRASAMAREGTTTPTAIDPDNPNGVRPQSARRSSWKGAKFRTDKTSGSAGSTTAPASVPEASSDTRRRRTQRRVKTSTRPR